MGKKKSKGKKVNFELIPPEHQAYRLLQRARDKWHEAIAEARIALAWRLEVKSDIDGKIVLGKCAKVSDLQKEFAAFDFIVVLNRDYWFDFSGEQQLALLDHELSHAAPAMDLKTGLQATDTRGRPVWRCRKHDIEEFTGVAERHGTWKADLQRFAEAIRKHRDGQGDLFEQPSESPKPEDVTKIAATPDPSSEPGDDLELTIRHENDEIKTTGKTVRECFEKADKGTKPKRRGRRAA